MIAYYRKTSQYNTFKKFLFLTFLSFFIFGGLFLISTLAQSNNPPSITNNSYGPDAYADSNGIVSYADAINRWYAEAFDPNCNRVAIKVKQDYAGIDSSLGAIRDGPYSDWITPTCGGGGGSAGSNQTFIPWTPPNPGYTYSYSYRAKDEPGLESGWRETKTFTVRNEAPRILNRWPEDGYVTSGSLQEDNSFNLYIRGIDPEGFSFLINYQIKNSSGVIVKDIITRNQTYFTCQNPGTYYWRVRLKDYFKKENMSLGTEYWTEWTDWWSFTITPPTFCPDYGLSLITRPDDRFYPLGGYFESSNPSYSGNASLYFAFSSPEINISWTAPIHPLDPGTGKELIYLTFDRWEPYFYTSTKANYSVNGRTLTVNKINIEKCGSCNVAFYALYKSPFKVEIEFNHDSKEGKNFRYLLEIYNNEGVRMFLNSALDLIYFTSGSEKYQYKRIYSLLYPGVFRLTVTSTSSWDNDFFYTVDSQHQCGSVNFDACFQISEADPTEIGSEKIIIEIKRKATGIPGSLSNADFGFLKTVNKNTARAGDILTYTILAENKSITIDASSVIIKDTINSDAVELVTGSISDGGTFNSSTNTITWNIGTLNKASSKVVNYKVKVKSSFSGTFSNLAVFDCKELVDQLESSVYVEVRSLWRYFWREITPK